MTVETPTLQSMTGFARADDSGLGRRWSWELRSVNGKGLDVRFRAPSGFERFEQVVRERVVKLFARGNIQVTLTLQSEEHETAIRVNQAALDALVGITRKLRGDDEAAPAVEQLLAIRGIVELVDSAPSSPEDLEGLVLESLDDALKALADMRRREGATIHAILADRLGRMTELVEQASANPARTPAAIRARLAEQVAALLDASTSLDADRLHQEAALLATRADVGEEIDRLTAHIAAARDLLDAEGAIGRKLDFLAQEFNRETNTLCAKSNDRSLTAIGLDLKAVVDQFREQVQNLE